MQTIAAHARHGNHTSAAHSTHHGRPGDGSGCQGEINKEDAEKTPRIINKQETAHLILDEFRKTQFVRDIGRRRPLLREYLIISTTILSLCKCTHLLYVVRPGTSK